MKTKTAGYFREQFPSMSETLRKSAAQAQVRTPDGELIVGKGANSLPPLEPAQAQPATAWERMLNKAERERDESKAHAQRLADAAQRVLDSVDAAWGTPSNYSIDKLREALAQWKKDLSSSLTLQDETRN